MVSFRGGHEVRKDVAFSRTRGHFERHRFMPSEITLLLERGGFIIFVQREERVEEIPALCARRRLTEYQENLPHWK